MSGNRSFILNQTLVCFPNFDAISFAKPSTRVILSCISVLICIVTVCINSLVIYCIYKTKQWKNQSTFLVLIASVCDVFGSLTSDIWSAVYIIFVNEIQCKVKLLMIVISRSFIYGAAYCFCLISIDRFFRVKYLQLYPDVMTSLRFRIMILVYVFVVFLQGVFSWIGPKIKKEEVDLTRPINVIIFTSTLIFYLVSVKILRRFDKQQKLIMEGTRKLTSMAAIYITIYMVFYLPLIMYQIMYTSFIVKNLSEAQLGVLSFTVFNLPSIHGDCNGIVFLVLNRPSKRLILEGFKKLRRFFSSFKSTQVVLYCPETKDVPSCSEIRIVQSCSETKDDSFCPKIKDTASCLEVCTRKSKLVQ